MIKRRDILGKCGNKYIWLSLFYSYLFRCKLFSWIIFCKYCSIFLFMHINVPHQWIKSHLNFNLKKDDYDNFIWKDLFRSFGCHRKSVFINLQSMRISMEMNNIWIPIHLIPNTDILIRINNWIFHFIWTIHAYLNYSFSILIH